MFLVTLVETVDKFKLFIFFVELWRLLLFLQKVSSFILLNLLFYLLDLFVSNCNQLVFPILKQLKEVVYREDQPHEEAENMARYTYLCLEVSNPHITHYKDPGQYEWGHHIDKLTK